MESPRITSPKAFSPTPSVAASTRIPSPSIQSVAPSCVDQLDDLLMPLHIGSPPQTRIFDTHPAIAQLLHAHGFTALPTPPSVPAAPSFSAVPTPFGVATKSVTHTTGTNENGQHFTQQHYTVNTQEWYTPMYGRIMQQQPQLMSPPSTVAPSASPPQQQNEFSNGNGSGGGAARVWRPEITPNTEMSRFQTSTHQVPYKVSLEHNNSSVPPKGFNSAALPFNTDPRVKHLQYNSPMNLYSNASAAEQYAQQTAGIVSQEGSAERARSDQPAYLRSETLKMVKEQENGTSSLSSHPNPHGLPACYVCTRPILGVMAQAAGHTLHGDCLSCSTCGSSLKNIGHHFIDGKFYCDIHARLKRSTSTGPSDPNLMARIPPTAAQPMRPSEPPRATYQPDTLTRRPLSVSPNPAQWTSQTNTTNITVSNPKTQGVISPANRGVPSSQMYGADLGRSTSRATAPPVGDYRPFAQTAAAPPPPPSNPPPATSYSTTSRQTNQQQRSETHTLNQQVPGGKVPFCEACKQQIRGAFVLAQGMSWCPEHFICANASCARRLLECGFVEENGQKFCESCFESNIAPRCAKCTKPIISDCLNALQKKWHPACFTCAHCSKAFGNSAFYLEQGLPYCENDWNRLFTTKCYQCTYPIEAGDRWVEALGHAYHSNCFNCTRCNVNLEGESFYAKNGDPFCKLHA